ncbi:MAG: type II secretion system protein [Verrucomicrobiota bacterium]|nr:type II secretion system protein [Verrucomicrobiota bacterium]
MKRRKIPNHNSAFTLLELLVVIAIIGVLATLVVGVAGVASRKMKEARVKADLNNLITAIESYKAEVGSYPSDNRLNLSDHRVHSSRNPLFYELSGAVFTNGNFKVLNHDEIVNSGHLRSVFGIGGIQNSSRDPRDVPYRRFNFKPSQFKELDPILANGADIELLAVPVKGPYMLKGKVGEFNPWFYDASTTNRHNRNGFDLWAEIELGDKITVIGNWRN